MGINTYLNQKKKVSVSAAYLSLFRRGAAAIYNKISIFKPFFLIFDKLYHRKIMNVLKSVDKLKYEYNVYKKINIEKDTFFYFWWDGFDCLPDLCRKCYESLNNHANGHKVIFLDKFNINKYIDIPNFIIDKFEKKCFSITLFSDIIRLILLSTYDCIWVDSTMYFINSIPKNAFNANFISCNSKYILKDINNATVIVNRHYPVYFFISKNGYIFKDVLNLLLKYWYKYDTAIDYFQTNFCFDYVTSFNKKYKEFIEKMDEFCPRVEWLLNNKYKTYNQDVLVEILKDTFMFKLNWKLLKLEDLNKHKESYIYHIL